MSEPNTAPATPAGTETTLFLKRVFPVSPRKVFEAWTTPAGLKQWFAISHDYATSVADLELKIGGRYRLGMRHIAKGIEHVVTGVYQEIVPDQRLVFTWEWEDRPEEGRTLITVTFRDLGESTEMLFTQQFFPSPEVCQKHLAGWEGCFGMLGSILSPSGQPDRK